MAILTDRTELDEAPVAADLLHIIDVSDTTDDVSGSSKKITLENLQKYIHNVGSFDYNDLATQTTPIAVTSGTSPVKLTNDELGAQTLKTYAPDGVTDIWDATSNEFDFSELALGDMIDFRLDIHVTTSAPFQFVDCDIRLALGTGSEYVVHVAEQLYKTAGLHHVFGYTGIYIGNTDTLDNGGYFEVTSDDDCSVVVNGWYCKIIKK